MFSLQTNAFRKGMKLPLPVSFALQDILINVLTLTWYKFRQRQELSQVCDSSLQLAPFNLVLPVI